MNKDIRTLYIHIGSHKTGTTSIQNALLSHKSYLLENGITLFHEHPKGGFRKIANVHPWMSTNIDAFLKDDKSMVIQGVKPRFFEKVVSSGKNVLISSESFSYFFDKNSIQKLVEQFYKNFDVIKVLVYIRRQDSHVISHHQQGSKSPNLGAAKLYGNRPRALPVYEKKMDYYLDYHFRLGLWADLIGDENISIRIFDRGLLKNGDAVDDFFACLGLEKQVETEVDNQSLGFIRTKVGHLINHSNISLNRSKILRSKLDNSGKLIPSRQEALEFYSHYREGNQKLNQRFKLTENEYLFSDDFSAYPEQADDLWEEDSANLAIKTLLLSLKASPVLSKKELFYLESLLPELKEKDVDLAKDFERLLVRLKEQSSKQAALPKNDLISFKRLKKILKPYYYKLLSLLQK